MENREQKIRNWFKMWLTKNDLGIKDIFEDNAIYIESYGPKYDGLEDIRNWFFNWNKNCSVINWEIKDFFHKKDKTIVEWYFECIIENEEKISFDGITLAIFSNNGKIKFLKEFACNEE